MLLQVGCTESLAIKISEFLAPVLLRLKETWIHFTTLEVKKVLSRTGQKVRNKTACSHVSQVVQNILVSLLR